MRQVAERRACEGQRSEEPEARSEGVYEEAEDRTYNSQTNCYIKVDDTTTVTVRLDATDTSEDAFNVWPLTISLNGGDPFFAIAETIAHAAPQDPGSENGWSSTGRQNRYAIISDINNPTYQPLRQFIYDYHRQGLDKMAEKPDDARESMLNAIAQLQGIYERNPMCYFLQLLIESKRDEIIQVFSQGDMKIRTEAANIMKTIDPSQSSRYDEMLQNTGR